MKERLIFIGALLVLVSLALGACAASPTPIESTPIEMTPAETMLPESYPLMDTQWELTQYMNAQGQLTDVLAETQVTLEFSDGKLSGSAGCNSFFGDYQSNAGSLTIGSVGHTEMFCTSPEGVMEQESAYLSTLTGAASYTIDDESLTITNADGENILIFRILKPVTLADEDWEMVALNNGQGEIVPALAGSSVTASFNQDGSLSGSAGCNHYGSMYVVNGEQITIPAPAATRMFCSEPAGLMEQENAYLAALASAASYRIQQGVLELYDAGEALVVRFQVYQPAAQPTPPPVLAGTSWMWREFQSSAGDVTAPQNPEKYTLTFKENEAVEIQADCNHVEGTYRAEGSSLIIQPGAPGPALCSPASLSDRFLQLLGDSTTYLITAEYELAISILNDSGILYLSPLK